MPGTQSLGPARTCHTCCLCPVQLVLSGERDKLKKLARERLLEAGWTDEVRNLCRGV